MPAIHFITRGERDFGTGHLHRTSWLHAMFTAQPALAGQIEVWCNDDPVPRAHFAGTGIPARFAAHPTRAWLDARAAGPPAAPTVCVLDKLDSYPESVKAMRAAGAKVALLDDYGPAQIEADLVVNSLLAPLASSEEQLGRARLLSGSDYLALSPAVTRLRGIAHALNKSLEAGPAAPGQIAPLAPAPRTGPVRGIMVSAGGIGSALINTLALAALSYTGFSGQVNVMPEPNRERGTRELGGFQVTYHPAGPAFHELLAASDLAVLAGGISLYEAAFLGVPALVVPLAEHQLATARKLSKAGCCVLADEPATSLHRVKMLDPTAFGAVGSQLAVLIDDQQLRGQMSAAGTKLFDGHGLERTAQAIMELAGIAMA